jgi:hypothetical protein
MNERRIRDGDAFAGFEPRDMEGGVTGSKASPISPEPSAGRWPSTRTGAAPAIVCRSPRPTRCLIRSGQDWSDTDGGERRMYLDEVEPVLRAGMDFLRDEGRTVGCYANRYLRVIDDRGDPLDRHALRGSHLCPQRFRPKRSSCDR